MQSQCDRVLPTCNHCGWAAGRECKYTPLPTPAHRGIPRCDRCRQNNLKVCHLVHSLRHPSSARLARSAAAVRPKSARMQPLHGEQPDGLQLHAQEATQGSQRSRAGGKPPGGALRFQDGCISRARAAGRGLPAHRLPWGAVHGPRARGRAACRAAHQAVCAAARAPAPGRGARRRRHPHGN